MRCLENFKPALKDWSPSDWALATTGELGELCNFLKKRRRGDSIDPKAIRDEFADVILYLDLWAASEGIDLAEAVISKFNEVSDRNGSHIKFEELK